MIDSLAKLRFISIVFVCCALFISSNSFATNNAFPYTKHGGGTTDGYLPYPYPLNDGNGYGVDRAINFDDYGVSGYYNNQSAEAGKYVRGECTHCHEPHASFGETEPSPNLGNDAGPAPYLAMKDYGGNVQNTRNYAELCWFCHEKMTLGVPSKPIGSGYYGFYQGKTVYQASSHYNSSNFYWPGTSGDPVSIWPRQNRSGLPDGSRGSCLNCHTPHGIKASGAGTAFDTTSPDGSGGVPAARQTVASGNPSVNQDYLIPRQLISWEENLCERCHDAGGPSSNNIQDEINKRVIVGQSGHPVDDTALAGRHVANETLPITTKHVECYDCHNPHAVKAPTGVPGDGDGGRIQGVKYIDINGSVKEPAPVGVRQPFIYEVCFKCHGSSYKQVFVNDNPFPDVATNRDAASFSKYFSNKQKEFDPSSHQHANYPGGDIGYNTAYHPVAAPGRNGTEALYEQLRDAFGLASKADLQTLTINCTDCHNTDATAPPMTNPVTVRGPVTQSSLRSTDKASVYTPPTPVGPHGSTNKKLLRGNYVTTNTTGAAFACTATIFSGCFETNDWYKNNRLDTNGKPKFELCFFCHREDVLIPNIPSTPACTTCTNFGKGNTTPGGYFSWNSNLHVYHLNAKAVCHDCHNNIHSNVEAQNTIYGNGLGGQLPPDSEDSIPDGKISTHLINFGPQASGKTASKPRWYWAGTYYRCDLVCHSVNMSVCTYTHGGGTPLCARGYL